MEGSIALLHRILSLPADVRKRILAFWTGVTRVVWSYFLPILRDGFIIGNFSEEAVEKLARAAFQKLAGPNYKKGKLGFVGGKWCIIPDNGSDSSSSRNASENTSSSSS